MFKEIQLDKCRAVVKVHHVNKAFWLLLILKRLVYNVTRSFDCTYGLFALCIEYVKLEVGRV